MALAHLRHSGEREFSDFFCASRMLPVPSRHSKVGFDERNPICTFSGPGPFVFQVDLVRLAWGIPNIILFEAFWAWGVSSRLSQPLRPFST